jgi:hypothetical protein
MRSISNFRIILVGIIILSLAFCSNDKKDSNPNTNDSSQSTNDSSNAPKSNRSLEGVTDSSSEPKKPEIPMNIDPNIALVREMNEKLKNVRYPDGNTIEGFEYKKWEIPNRQDFVKWIKASGNIIKESLDRFPDTIKLEISGHADTSGPEEKEGNKLGNLYYSKKRAETVKSSLVKLGFPENRISAKGLGSSDPIPGIEGTSAKNRRVTFKLINESATSESDETDK